MPASLGSLPIIGDDFSIAPPTNVQSLSNQKSPTFPTGDYENGEVSEMSCSSSSSDSDSDSDHDQVMVPKTTPNKTNGYSNGVQNSGSSSKPSMPADHFLNEDLNLSDSCSD